jgi:hypothetical protein
MFGLRGEKLREAFETQVYRGRQTPLPFSQLVLAVRHSSGAIEFIINTENVESKIDYVLNVYNSKFQLHANPTIEIAGYLLL